MSQTLNLTQRENYIPSGKFPPHLISSESWFYLFVHHAKLERMKKKIEEKFRVFIHTRIVYIRDKNKIKKEERPSVSGLIFIQGRSEEIQIFLDENLQGAHLVKDCSTKKPAEIKDSIMQPFMQISTLDTTRIRFMPHPFKYYSEGNHLIRITSGTLVGLEGYRIRIARDKCLITSIGGLTVAIGGIHKESFENLEEYVKQRVVCIKDVNDSRNTQLTAIQKEIKKSFFVPQNQMDIIAIAHSISMWMEKLKEAIQKKDYDEVSEMSLFLLEEIGDNFNSANYNIQTCNVEEIITNIRDIDEIIEAMSNNIDTPSDIKDRVLTERKALTERYPFLFRRN